MHCTERKDKNKSVIGESNNESLVKKLVDAIDKVLNDLIINLSDSDIEVIKIKNSY